MLDILRVMETQQHGLPICERILYGVVFLYMCAKALPSALWHCGVH